MNNIEIYTAVCPRDQVLVFPDFKIGKLKLARHFGITQEIGSLFVSPDYAKQCLTSSSKNGKKQGKESSSFAANITFLIRIITLIYFLAFLLSIVCLYLGTISQLHKYELERIKTKSDIKRGMSLFPTFPLTSILYLLFLYFLNSYKDDLGTYLVFGYGICVSLVHLSYFVYCKYQISKFRA